MKQVTYVKECTIQQNAESNLLKYNEFLHLYDGFFFFNFFSIQVYLRFMFFFCVNFIFNKTISTMCVGCVFGNPSTTVSFKIFSRRWHGIGSFILLVCSAFEFQWEYLASQKLGKIFCLSYGCGHKKIFFSYLFEQWTNKVFLVILKSKICWKKNCVIILDK